MSKRSRTKGAVGEREVVNVAKAHGFPAQRTFSQIEGDRCDVTGVPGCAIEVKRTESLNIWAALKQAEDAAGDLTPVVAFRRNGSEWFAAVPLDDFLELIKTTQREEA